VLGTRALLVGRPWTHCISASLSRLPPWPLVGRRAGPRFQAPQSRMGRLTCSRVALDTPRASKSCAASCNFDRSTPGWSRASSGSVERRRRTTRQASKHYRNRVGLTGFSGYSCRRWMSIFACSTAAPHLASHCGAADSPPPSTPLGAHRVRLLCSFATVFGQTASSVSQTEDARKSQPSSTHTQFTAMPPSSSPVPPSSFLVFNLLTLVQTDCSHT